MKNKLYFCSYNKFFDIHECLTETFDKGYLPTTYPSFRCAIIPSTFCIEGFFVGVIWAEKLTVAYNTIIQYYGELPNCKGNTKRKTLWQLWCANHINNSQVNTRHVDVDCLQRRDGSAKQNQEAEKQGENGENYFFPIRRILHSVLAQKLTTSISPLDKKINNKHHKTI